VSDHSEEAYEVRESMRDTIKKLQAENNRLREALGVYADEKNWCPAPNLDTWHGAVGCELAQQALNKKD